MGVGALGFVPLHRGRMKLRLFSPRFAFSSLKMQWLCYFMFFSGASEMICLFKIKFKTALMVLIFLEFVVTN